MEGYGPSLIANIEEDKILVPSEHYKSIGISYPDPVLENPYAWQSRTLADSLSQQEYLGRTVNFKLSKNSTSPRINCRMTIQSGRYLIILKKLLLIWKSLILFSESVKADTDELLGSKYLFFPGCCTVQMRCKTLSGKSQRLDSR